MVQSERFPLLAKLGNEGWPRHQKMVPFRRGADRVVNHKLLLERVLKHVV